MVSHPGKRLRLQWNDGRRGSVDASDLMPCVFVSSVAGVDTADLEGMPARVYAMSSAVDNPGDAAKRRAAVFAPDSAQPLPMPPLALYWRGGLYALPFNLPGVPKATVKADLQWLLNRLTNIH